MKTAFAATIFFAGLLYSIAAEKPLNERPATPIELDFQGQAFLTAEHYAGNANDFKRIKRGDEGIIDGAEIATVRSGVQRFQNFVLDCKNRCAAEIGFAPNEVEKSFLNEKNPTPKEKTLIACVLERTKIMDSNNKVSLDTISGLAGLISNNNELIMAIARMTAEHCNRFVNSSNKYEAAAQINRCIAQGIKAHNIKISY